MKKVVIVTDSVACLTPEQVKQHDIEVIPLNFYAGGRQYRDGVDVTTAEAYELFLKEPDTFKTSGASPEDCVKAYRQAAAQASSILCITCSAQISMVNNAAHIARDMVKSELPDTHIEIFDSTTAAPSEGLVALAAAEAASRGADLEEALETARDISQRVNCIVFLETLRHVYRSGRIPKIASTLGSALNIRPIFTVKTTVRFVGMSRSKEASIERTLEMMRDSVGSEPIRVAVTHAYAPEEAEKFKKLVAREFNCSEIWITEFSPIMGYACGTGTLGVAYHTVE